VPGQECTSLSVNLDATIITFLTLIRYKLLFSPAVKQRESHSKKASSSDEFTFVSRHILMKCNETRFLATEFVLINLRELIKWRQRHRLVICLGSS
jgi:hypothetical protein